jgi:putative ABC transport system ATP-binding protein
MESKRPFLEAEGLYMNRGPGPEKKAILKGVSFAISPGELILVQGTSGAGKSSLLLALARLLPLEKGRLLLEGRPDAEWAPPRWRERVALVVQKHSVVPGTIRENLLLPWTLKVRQPSSGGAPANLPRDELLEQELDGVGLDEVKLDAPAEKLSTGQTGRLSLVRTLLTNPGCLLLDEPLAALDPDNTSRVLDRIHVFIGHGGAVLMVSHDGHSPRNGRRLTLEEGRLKEVHP